MHDKPGTMVKQIGALKMGLSLIPDPQIAGSRQFLCMCECSTARETCDKSRKTISASAKPANNPSSSCYFPKHIPLLMMAPEAEQSLTLAGHNSNNPHGRIRLNFVIYQPQLHCTHFRVPRTRYQCISYLALY
jgi:hypothetical protein